MICPRCGKETVCDETPVRDDKTGTFMLPPVDWTKYCLCEGKDLLLDIYAMLKKKEVRDGREEVENDKAQENAQTNNRIL